jgi:hypothetical protein
MFSPSGKAYPAIEGRSPQNCGRKQRCIYLRVEKCVGGALEELIRLIRS